MDQTMGLLKKFFVSNADLRVFAMNGSRVNPQIADDKFKDYDVVFFTDQVKKYRLQQDFLQVFGEILIMTEPEDDDLSPPWFPKDQGYIFLVQYTNGVRIDFQFRSLKLLPEYLKEDSLTQIIADKEGLTDQIDSTDQDYWLTYPSQKAVIAAIKEFWWQSLSVLKATLRGELLLAQFYLRITRDEVIRLMTWQTALTYGFERSYGKQQTQILPLLDENERAALLATYHSDGPEAIYTSLLQLMALTMKFSQLLKNEFNLSEDFLQELPKIPEKYLLSKQEPKLAKKFKL
ncbi:aminoglycoside 6-adenylyltransferase [Enterococcus sp. HY326]|uniref:aminoglycoside 6-adenylyltransferase n=1 Tax=Enterococcus sp. HY326 TaxID=2971265 RepID=UPI00223F9123|nr:aminoglycoside 6-adenylyltransferase [Enterococcus sp. HY326]